mmetsp:Transcript_32083/g.89811  ORF Transcript_32083/g.89811 Transcript_32083/m.89811 type:complete len:219 (+) Transcript_32083:1209-1865(+)
MALCQYAQQVDHRTAKNNITVPSCVQRFVKIVDVRLRRRRAGHETVGCAFPPRGCGGGPDGGCPREAEQFRNLDPTRPLCEGRGRCIAGRREFHKFGRDVGKSAGEVLTTCFLQDLEALLVPRRETFLDTFGNSDLRMCLHRPPGVRKLVEKVRNPREGFHQVGGEDMSGQELQWEVWKDMFAPPPHHVPPCVPPQSIPPLPQCTPLIKSPCQYHASF